MDTQNTSRTTSKSTRRTSAQLAPGDIIFTYIPFEENTPDYYNGHAPHTIRNPEFVNRRGEAGKSRVVIYMGRDGDSILYLPITSSIGNKSDQFHQYRLKNNDCINRNGKYPNSYVEIDSLRALSAHPKKTFKAQGSIMEDDLNNIMHRVTHTTMQLASSRDYRGIIPHTMESDWANELLQGSFRHTETTPTHKTYTNGDVSITRNTEGMVHYHRDTDKETIRLQVSQREGRLLPPLPETRDFARHIEDLTDGASPDRRGQQL